MQHRHLTAKAGWSKAAVDSLLDRGDLADWQKLFAAVARDDDLAATVIEIAQQHHTPGSALAIHLAERYRTRGRGD